MAVYGTLRRGGVNDINRLSPAPVFVGRAHLMGELYHLGAYPGVLLTGEGRVVAEVYAITRELESQIDELEAVYPQQSDEYFKRRMPVPVCDGRVLNCIVYEINPRCARGKPRIHSGDWLSAC